MKMFIALLRGINVGGNNPIPMKRLCSLCGDLGWHDVQSYIQSGNLVFTADGTAATLESGLEQVIRKEFGFSITIIVRSATDWPRYVKNNPFPAASKKEPKLVMLGLAKSAPKPDAVERLRERAIHGERIERAGDALWVHFKNGVAGSKLSPALFDRSAGSPVTLRNWRTVLKLQEMTGR